MQIIYPEMQVTGLQHQRQPVILLTILDLGVLLAETIHEIIEQKHKESYQQGCCRIRYDTVDVEHMFQPGTLSM